MGEEKDFNMTTKEFDDLCVEAGGSDRNILITYLFERRKSLQDWKDSMMAVEREWDQQRIAKLLGAKLGQSCRKVVNERVPVLVAERAILIDALREIANEDYRGNRTHSAVVAFSALVKIGVEI
jgi:hypothetical protein